MFFREIYLASYSEAVKDINLQKSKKNAFTNPTLFVFKIRIPPDSLYCVFWKISKRFKETKINTAKSHMFLHLLF